MSTTSEPELRALIRELIKEVLPQIDNLPPRRTVTITNDEQLNSFITQLVGMLDNPLTGPPLRSGELKFHLTTGTTEPPAPVPNPIPPTPATIEIERGVLTERIVARAVTEHAQLVLGPHVVITPLAREQIRKSSVTVVTRP
jgi:hypothetical protein